MESYENLKKKYDALLCKYDSEIDRIERDLSIAYEEMQELADTLEGIMGCHNCKHSDVSRSLIPCVHCNGAEPERPDYWEDKEA